MFFQHTLLSFSPLIPQPPEAPKNTTEAKESVAEVKVDTNGNEEQKINLDTEKKKLNKRERKEARQQKNGKRVKCAEEMVAQEPEEDQGGKKKKKDRKRKHSPAEDEDQEQNGHNAEKETVNKKKKTSKTISQMHNYNLLIDYVLF